MGTLNSPALMLPSTSLREALLACPPSPPWNLPSFTFSSFCSRTNPPLSRQGAALAHLESLPPHNLVTWTNGSILFPSAKDSSNVFANCSLCGAEATLFFSEDPVCSSFFAKACAILLAFCWCWQHQQRCHFSSLLLSASRHPVLFFIFSFISISLADLSSLSSSTIRLQWIPVHLFFPGNDAADKLARRGALLVPSFNPL